MRIGMIGAMDEEIALYLQEMEQRKETVKAGIRFYEGVLNGKTVVLCKSGVGKVNAAVTTQMLIDQFNVEQIIFTGVAGAAHPDLNIGDIVVSTDCLQHDMDVTALGFPAGQIPFAEKSVWEADRQLIDLAVRAGQSLAEDVQVVTGRVLSGDQFIANHDKVEQLFTQFQAHCIEMEGAAVGQVCAMNEVPFVIVRSMSDKADGSAHVNFAEFTELAARRSFAIVQSMLQQLGANVIVYSTQNCVDCEIVKKWLKEKGVAFEVRDVMTSKQYQEEVERFGFMGVPVTVCGDKAVKGFQPNELEKLLESR
ncbi:5'-methylthioadenosine/adenosylhomocysteine nucleosidase [Brevibacillus fulvus]|uniref:adenosylhomocysteine nucleosidase n=1 Tax=Brevibacillus fulvus TaxID=1125967 RepID=A0A939BSJ6_9BACL|nr:5'-methylthioadenosine/adenosylhomocysteine nucleosidase [Brevibacillus fulvus]MBM7590792.1 adenosylhomocysteine nucleosidase [Brevibacillus fulvus]